MASQTWALCGLPALMRFGWRDARWANTQRCARSNRYERRRLTRRQLPNPCGEIARRSEIAACRNSGNFRQAIRTRTPSSFEPECRTVVNILLTNLKDFFGFLLQCLHPSLAFSPSNEFPLYFHFRACPKGTGRLSAVRLGITHQTRPLPELSALSRPSRGNSDGEKSKRRGQERPDARGCSRPN